MTRKVGSGYEKFVRIRIRQKVSDPYISRSITLFSVILILKHTGTCLFVHNPGVDGRLASFIPVHEVIPLLTGPDLLEVRREALRDPAYRQKFYRFFKINFIMKSGSKNVSFVSKNH
jgi:hypothetical protein